jgi:hypothetical protein
MMRSTKDSLGLAIEAAHETKIVGSPEAEALQDAICNAVRAYSDFLERHGLIWEDGDPDAPRLKAQALVVTLLPRVLGTGSQTINGRQNE